ncbi:HAMP domain-containing histidine kinase [Phormidium sp. LEGE 05292]|uniref:GAF domain-containing sensor histidine kinase n=1 Tax=[Phormidium] sp. LEGE 05292 TaxID=767427 RepID=UPI0018811C3C|nr:HAMP domain-containing sensor histidine kinase [Phormidium sp. LEGE 05292]MBE9229096.1 HAMP domain-containing histidine kinase [Phormidium sp. LEGE 05292]
MAISQVHLYKQFDTSSRHQALLNQLTIAIRSCTELEQILKLAVDGLVRTLQIERSLILFLKYVDPLIKNRSQKPIPRAKATVIYEWSILNSEGNQPSPSSINQSFSLSDCGLCQMAYQHSPKPLIFNEKNSTSYGDSTEGVTAIFDLDSMPNLLLISLESQGTVLGFLALQQRQPRVWLTEELELVELVSAQLSIAILQFQTLRQTSALVQERTDQLEWSLSVQKKLYEKTRQQIDQLRRLNALKDEFLSTMNDQMRNPLASMRMAICMLRQPGLPVERQVRYLDILEQQCNLEINLINDLLTLQELKSHKTKLQPQKVDIREIIERLEQSFTEKWSVKGLSMEVHLPKRSLILYTDADSVNRILNELLTNAGKYSEPDTKVVLRAIYQANQKVPQIVLSLSNIGSSISPAEQDYIFEEFRRGEGVMQKGIQGTGLGLALVKSLVEHLNGVITVSSSLIENSPSSLTCFTLTLPQMQG